MADWPVTSSTDPEDPVPIDRSPATALTDTELLTMSAEVTVLTDKDEADKSTEEPADTDTEPLVDSTEIEPPAPD